jgi:hypothetical protein
MDWTPVVKQGAVTPTITINDAVFTIQDGWVTGHCALSITASAGVAGNEIKITAADLPPAFDGNAGNGCGTFKYIDASVASVWEGSVVVNATTADIQFNAAGYNGVLGVDPSFATAGSDTFKVEFCYRHA